MQKLGNMLTCYFAKKKLNVLKKFCDMYKYGHLVNTFGKIFKINNEICCRIKTMNMLKY